MMTNQDTAPHSLGQMRKRKLARKSALWLERSSWDSHWAELSRFQQPRLGRFFVTDRNRGQRRDQSILDNAALMAQRTLSAGMMSGMTSPARPWFKLALEDTSLAKHGSVKVWLTKVNDLMRRIYQKSNTYSALRSCYGEIGLFGTWANFVMDDFDTVIHHHPMTVGEYAIATDGKGRVNTLAREFQMTVAQMVEMFGKENCSTTVQNMWTSDKYDAWVTVVHIVEPRTERDPKMRDARNMPFASHYLEPAAEAWDKFLRESGFQRFPALCPRWDIAASGDIYGESPGMHALGDVKQLQHEQMSKGQAIDYMVKPPIQVPSVLKGQTGWRLPGGVAYVDQSGPHNGIRSSWDVNVDLGALLGDIQDVRGRIDRAYFADLFLMLANDTRSGTTATEIVERHEEKLLMLGPVLERLHNELLSPMIDMTFDRIVSAGLLTGELEPPQELEGVDLKVEFVSVLAQAQQMVSAGSLDRFVSTIGQMAGAFPSVLDKLDSDRVVDEYGEVFGVNPEIIVPEDVVAERRAARAQQAAAQQAAAAMPAVVDAAQTASEIDVDNIRNVMEGLTGYGTMPAL